jgi:hypothetical protein
MRLAFLLLAVAAASVSCGHLISDTNATFYQLTCPDDNNGCSNATGRCTVHAFSVSSCLPSAESGNRGVEVLACYPRSFKHIEAHIVVRTFDELNCTGTFADTNQVVGRCFHSTMGSGQYVINECGEGQEQPPEQRSLRELSETFGAKTEEQVRFYN